jgi:adenine-specific DNA-methyltransferase
LFKYASSEQKRTEIQVALDTERTSLERNKAGQFATPPELARDIMKFAVSTLGSAQIDFLEPSCGSGSFISALLRTAPPERINAITGVELDPRFAKAATDLWGPVAEIVEGDFLKWSADSTVQANLVVANPPYVRHHHLNGQQKKANARACAAELGITVSQLAGLYVYFLLLTHKRLAPGAVSAWLIPTEFMDVNYGVALRQYLTTQVELVRIHRFDPADAQFEDALVSSAVLVFRNCKPVKNAVADFTFGGAIDEPRVVHNVPISLLKAKEKWIGHFQGRHHSERPAEVVGDFFDIRRGIATGNNTIFIRSRHELEQLKIDPSHYRPILPSPRNVPADDVTADLEGWPTNVEQLALIDTDEPMESLCKSDPALAVYLEAHDKGEGNGYLSRQRKPWYKQEQRPAPPFLCTYMGRGSAITEQPVRFILNRSRATASNGFLLLYPKRALAECLARQPGAIDQVHAALNSFTPEELRNAGRAYGGGLHKIEPSELAALDGSRIRAIIRAASQPGESSDLVEQVLAVA